MILRSWYPWEISVCLKAIPKMMIVCAMISVRLSLADCLFATLSVPPSLLFLRDHFSSLVSSCVCKRRGKMTWTVSADGENGKLGLFVSVERWALGHSCPTNSLYVTHRCVNGVVGTAHSSAFFLASNRSLCLPPLLQTANTRSC